MEGVPDSRNFVPALLCHCLCTNANLTLPKAYIIPNLVVLPHPHFTLLGSAGPHLHPSCSGPKAFGYALCLGHKMVLPSTRVGSSYPVPSAKSISEKLSTSSFHPGYGCSSFRVFLASFRDCTVQDRSTLSCRKLSEMSPCQLSFLQEYLENLSL